MNRKVVAVRITSRIKDLEIIIDSTSILEHLNGTAETKSMIKGYEEVEGNPNRRIYKRDLGNIRKVAKIESILQLSNCTIATVDCIPENIGTASESLRLATVEILDSVNSKSSNFTAFYTLAKEEYGWS